MRSDRLLLVMRDNALSIVLRTPSSRYTAILNGSPCLREGLWVTWILFTPRNGEKP